MLKFAGRQSIRFGSDMRLILFILFIAMPALVYQPSHAETALRPFQSDGCSLFPDGIPDSPLQWCSCCFEHDVAYWQGGTWQQRVMADMALRRCVLEKTGNEYLAEVMYNGVRTGGSALYPTWYRWGYGWSWGRGYAALNSEEQKQVKQYLDAYRLKQNDYACGTE